MPINAIINHFVPAVYDFQYSNAHYVVSLNQNKTKEVSGAASWELLSFLK